VTARIRAGAPGAVIIGVALVLFGGVTLRDTRNGNADHDARQRLASELTAVHAKVEIACDSTATQLAMGRYLLSWLEQTQDASSTGLVEAITRLRQRHRIPQSLDVLGELAATGQLQRAGDAALRTRLVALQQRLQLASAAGEPEFERYRIRLEDELSPGMWRLVFLGESGTLPVDYKATLRVLLDAGFEHTVRTVLRGVQDYQQHLNAIMAGTDSLLHAVLPGNAGATQS
jgi:hypothetical protein